VPCTSRALFRGGIELRRFDEAIVYRTKVWEYPGVNTFRTGRLDELAMHPTVKPVAMLADAIRDVTKRGAVVLDPFAGSGGTLIAAEKAGRRARCIEYEPKYCDVIVRRWQAYTGKAAIFEGIGLTFEDLEGARDRGGYRYKNHCVSMRSSSST
jgi:DNA modification methylase